MAKYIPGRNYIGSSEIATDLDVTGPATFSDTVTISGDVAIGTTSPEEILHIQKTDNDARIQIITSTARSSTIFFGDTDDRNAGIIEYDNNGDFMRFFANASERMRMTSGGNLLIGTTTDNGQKLQVNGGITLADNSFLTWKNSNTRIVGQSGYMVFQVAATDKMKINSNGNVLIGTTTDSGAKATIAGQAALLGNGFYGLLNLSGTNALADYNTANKIVMHSNGSTDGLYTGGLHLTRRTFSQQGDYGSGIRGLSVGTVLQDNALELYTSTNTEKNVTRLKITSTGSVGIGTDSPSQLLHIDNPTGGSSILLEGAGGWYSQILFRTNPSSGQGWLAYDYSGNTMTFGVSGSEKMRLKSDGKVGIGTTSPASILEINGGSADGVKIISANAGTEFVLNASTSNGTSRLWVGGTGNVGIGTTTPSMNLEVVGAYDVTPVKFLRHATYGNIIRLGRNGVSETAHIGYPADATLNFSTGGSERARITSGGNLLLGTTTDSGKKLQVNGSIIGTSAEFSSDIDIKNNGNANLSLSKEDNDQKLELIGGNGGVQMIKSSYELAFYRGGAEKMRLTTNGLLIGTTTDSGAYRLDVSGKARVQSVLELDDVLTLNAISTPADPASGKSSIYMDSADGAIKVKINVGGTVVTRTIASYE